MIFIVFFFTILELPALLVLGIWFLQQALYGYFDLTGQGGGVAYFAHIGGFVFGLLTIKLFATRKRLQRPTGARSRARDASSFRRPAQAPWRSSPSCRARDAEKPRSRRAGAEAEAPPAPLQEPDGAAGRRRDGALAARRAARGPARRGRDRLQAPAALGAAVRPRHGPRAVAARPDAGAADRQPDQDDDRARGRRAGAAGREGAHHQGGAALPGLGRRACSRAASGSASTRCCTACCCRPATTRRSRSHSAPRAAASKRFVRYMNEKAEEMGLVCTRFSSPSGIVDERQPLVRRGPRGDRPRRAARAAAGADRRAAPGGRSRSRSRAGGCGSTTTTRCCGGLPGHDRPQDRLHRGRGALPGRHRAPRPDQARRRPAGLARPRQAGDAAAGPRLQALRPSGKALE